ncbi:unnamed protein product [Candidula unifasciata]|uniref:Peptidase S1 domain-containing protein n=1 Tax=Candidula unifasciata TaxID=100452 RepID=A0A8S3Z6G6_9EUPU|nr:unnamed protein product [Candidula unifasciata]
MNILFDGIPRCAGVIINKFWILTSAFCVFTGLDANYTAVVGVNSFNSEDTGQHTFRFKQTIFNGLYGGSIDYDLALVKVNGCGIKFNDYVQPICLPVEGENKAAGRLLKLFGWGYQTELLTQHPSELKTIVVRVMSLTRCATFCYPGLVTARNMCVRQDRGQGDACKGDYGGPVTFQSGETHILSGIVSASISGCTIPSEGIVLSNILSYKNWIVDVINNYSNDTEKVIPRRNI